MKTEITQEELEKRIADFKPASDEIRNSTVCAIVSHSRIQTLCFGYYSCARCGAQVGDALGSVYPEAANVVVVGHNCDTCRENYKKLTWKDTLFAPDPFKEVGLGRKNASVAAEAE